MKALAAVAVMAAVGFLAMYGVQSLVEGLAWRALLGGGVVIGLAWLGWERLAQ